MPAAFWNDSLAAIFFIYGLAFYSLGLALLVESGRSSELGFARSMRLLAAFGLLHGLHEWLDMLQESCCYLSANLTSFLPWLRLIILVTSFIALAGFGEHLLAREKSKSLPSWKLTLGFIAFFTVSGILIQRVYQLQEGDWLVGLDVLGRYTIGIPAALLAARALWLQRRSFIERKMQNFVRWLEVAAVTLFIYGTCGQIFTPKSIVFPANWVNNVLFLELVGFPIQLLRALLACIIAVAMIRVLRSLEVENEQRLSSITEKQVLAEQSQNQRLAQLNEELRAANAESAHLLQELETRDALRGQWLQRITTAQEAERRRIARELHDDTGQVITGLAMALRGLRHVVENDPQKASNKLADLEQMATSALQNLRHLINDLRPPQLDDMGLVSALRFMQERMNETTSGKCQIHFSTTGSAQTLPQEVEITLFRIAQEAVTNGLKHAEAKNIHISLDYRTCPILCVDDDGKGFDAEQAMSANSLRMAWGLYGMSERAKLIDAELQIESHLGLGTKLQVSLSAAYCSEEVKA